MRSNRLSVLENGIWRGSWWLWFVSGLPPPSVAPHGVVALPSVGGGSLEHHSSVIRLTLLAGLGALSGLRMLSSRTRFLSVCCGGVFPVLLAAVWRLLYRRLCHSGGCAWSFYKSHQVC